MCQAGAASRRCPIGGINYIDHDYALAKGIDSAGLWSELYATSMKSIATRPYFEDFVTIVRDT